MTSKSKRISKKLINKVEDCVNENIAGYVAMNPAFRQLAGQPRVVVRADLLEHKSRGRVAILTGGGSGHEPAFIGWLGENMATGAVLGDVFAAPGAASILHAIRALGQNNTGGILMLFNNYTGDRLNFGMAAERARAEGVRVEMLLNADDTALITADKTAGRRGLAGLLFLIKIAGTLAEDGRSLEEIMKATKQATLEMGTLGLCLNACSVPGSGPLFEVAEDEMEIGLGLHGEAGVRTVQMKSAHDTVNMMLQHMTNPDNKIHLPVNPGDSIAVLVNNLGSMSDMEINILSKEVIGQLEARGVRVDRAYSGRSVTSQEMPGFSITIIHIDEERKSIIDRETKATAWPKSYQIDTLDRRTPEALQVEVSRNDKETDDKHKDILSQGESALLKFATNAACQSLVENEELLNRLDSRCGDGDCGSTLKTAAKNVVQMLRDKPELFTNPSRLILAIAETTENSVGGTSGALYSILFTAAGRQLTQSGYEQNWIEALRAGLQAVRKYGGAEPGDRTMVDPLYAAVMSVSDQGNNQQMLQRAVEAAEKEADLTARMVARAGRASYVSDNHLKQPDPGAKAVAIWMRAIY